MSRDAERPTSSAADGEHDALCAIADRVPEPLALARDGRVVHLNAAFRALFALPPEASGVPRPFVDFAAPESAKSLQALLRRALLLDLDNTARETMTFVPAEGPAFAAEVSVAPLALGRGQGLALTLQPTGRGAAGADTLLQDITARTDERGALLQRLAVLADDASPVERMAGLALVMVTQYARLRQQQGFAPAARMMHSLADCLATAAPPQARLFRVADDAFAVLAEDINAADLDRLRRRLLDAPAQADAALAQLRLSVGLVRVVPGAGAPTDLLDRALADAGPPASAPAGLSLSLAPSAIQTGAPDSTVAEASEGLDVLEPDFSTDAHPGAGDGPRLGLLRPESRGGATTRTTTSAGAAGETIVEDGLMARIQSALEGEGFTLAFQPIVSLMGDSREHYSVLVRLRRPDGTLTSAADIIRSAAGTGRMADIDRWVMRTAFALLSQRRRRGEKAAFFISLSADIVADEGLLIWICDALREFDLRGSWLTFQMQERDALRQAKAWAALAAGLRDIRCRICVNQHGLVDAADSGGVGKPDFVKFAPSLVDGLSHDKDKQHHLLELIRLARGRNVRTIITGVDDARSLNLLWDAGIEYVQGDYLQAPETGIDLPQSAIDTSSSLPDTERPRLKLSL
jgi:multidomain signaling protein FimX